MAIQGSKIITFFKEARRELGKVVWPSRREIVVHTIVVISISLVMAVVFGVLDLVFTFGIRQIL